VVKILNETTMIALNLR